MEYMHMTFLAGLVLVQIACLAWLVPAAIRDHKRLKALQRSVEQEMTYLDNAITHYKRATDPSLTAEQSAAPLDELYAARIGLEERAAAREE